jgi:hypothetical protein
MDPISIAAATLVAKWAAESLVKEAGKSAWEGLKKIYEAVSVKVKGNRDNKEVLQRLEKKPTSEARRAELAEVIDGLVKTDSDFAQQLRRLVDEAGSATTTGSFVTQVMGNAKVGKITNIGTIHGDVHF